MKKEEKKILEKICFYTEEFTKQKPAFDTVFRQYFEALVKVNKILKLMMENPWHPENDYGSQILDDISEAFEELEELRLKNVC